MGMHISCPKFESPRKSESKPPGICPNQKQQTRKDPTVKTISADENQTREWRWQTKPENLDRIRDEDKQRILAKVAKNHLYKWDNKILRQRLGGAIGVRAIGALAKVTMDQWMEKFRERLESLEIKLWLLKKYVDDVLVVVTNLPLGSRYRDGKILQSKESEKEDIQRDRSKSDVTMSVLKEVANEILPFLKYTGEVSVDGMPIPVLDTVIWR